MNAMSATSAAVATEPPNHATTIIYARVSTERQARKEKSSLADQERECRKFAAKAGRTVDFVWADPGVSGGDEERLERLAQWCEAHPRPARAGLIIALDATRWGRFRFDPDASSHFKRRLRKAGWVVEFASQPSTGDRLLDGVLGGLSDAKAAAYSAELARKVQWGMKRGAERGWVQGRPPFGYNRVAVSNTDPHKRRPLEAYERSAEGEHVELVKGDPDEVRTVQRIFAWYAEGHSLTAIAARLNKEGARGPWSRYNRGRRFTKPDSKGRMREALPDEWKAFANVDKILQCETYIGRRTFKPHDLTDYRKGETRDLLPLEEWVVTENANEAIISRDVWDAVQRRLSRPVKPRGDMNRYLLTGIVRCACGSEIVGGGGVRTFVLSKVAATHVQVGGRRSREFRRAKTGERATYRKVSESERTKNVAYKCRRCRPTITINREAMESAVIGEVAKHIKKLVTSGEFDRELDDVETRERSGLTAGRTELTVKMRAVEAKRANLLRAIEAEVISHEDARARMQELREEEAALRAERHKGHFAERGATITDKERAAFRAMASDFVKRIAKADAETARSLLSAWVAALTANGTNPKHRIASLVLRKVPVQSLSNSSLEGR